MASIERQTADRVSAVTAAVQAAFLIGYALTIAYLLITRGPQGPAEVASGPGVIAEIVTFALFGAGVIIVAMGRWRGRSWSTVPFIVIQLLTLTVSFPLMLGQDNESLARLCGVIATLAAIAGLGVLILKRLSDSDEAEAPEQQ